METTQGVPKKRFYKRTWFWILVGVIFFVIIGSSGTQPAPATTTNSQAPSSEAEKVISKEEAQKQIDEVIDLAKKAGLVTSYEFSDKASVVYVSSVWYTQTVQFKKDFMAKLSILKKSLNGFTRFEVRDYKSNELVGEVKYNSLEVYK